MAKVAIPATAATVPKETPAAAVAAPASPAAIPVPCKATVAAPTPLAA